MRTRGIISVIGHGQVNWEVFALFRARKVQKQEASGLCRQRADKLQGHAEW